MTNYKFVRREIRASNLFRNKGYKVIRTGWPDLVAYQPKTKKFRFIEVKAPEESLSKPQQEMHKFLKDFLGLDVEVLRLKRNGRIVSCKVSRLPRRRGCPPQKIDDGLDKNYSLDKLESEIPENGTI